MSINQLVIQRLKKNLNNIALINGNNKKEILSYKEFLNRCFATLDLFIEEGISNNEKILIPGVKSFETFILITSCLFYGITYTVYDPKSPNERLNKIIKGLKPKYLFSFKNQKNIHKITQKFNSLKIFNFSELKFLERLPNYENNYYEQIINQVDDKDLDAYIMFTSGSTGDPKGAIITRKNLYQFILWISSEFYLSNPSVNTNINPLYFDNSVFDIYSTIPFASTLIYYDLDLKSTINTLCEDFFNGIFHQWFSVPSLLIKIFKKTSNKNFYPKKNNKKMVIFGGEGFSAYLLKQMMIKFESYEFINVYGPTECTCIATINRLDNYNFEEFKGLPSLGKTIGNFSYEIANKNQNSIGELILQGDFVGKGYINNSKDQEKFFNNADSINSYKTGDLVKEINNELFHCGRVDNQIKRMGFRIELEEIEYIATSIIYINDAAAIFKKEENRSYLFLIVKLSTNFNKNEVLRGLKNNLPSYMYPDDILITKKLCRNRNGKIDRKTVFKSIDSYISIFSL